MLYIFLIVVVVVVVFIVSAVIMHAHSVALADFFSEQLDESIVYYRYEQPGSLFTAAYDLFRLIKRRYTIEVLNDET